MRPPGSPQHVDGDAGADAQQPLDEHLGELLLVLGAQGCRGRGRGPRLSRAVAASAALWPAGQARPAVPRTHGSGQQVMRCVWLGSPCEGDIPAPSALHRGQPGGRAAAVGGCRVGAATARAATRGLPLEALTIEEVAPQVVESHAANSRRRRRSWGRAAGRVGDTSPWVGARAPGCPVSFFCQTCASSMVMESRARVAGGGASGRESALPQHAPHSRRAQRQGKHARQPPPCAVLLVRLHPVRQHQLRQARRGQQGVWGSGA